jgi:hypothetical protein
MLVIVVDPEFLYCSFVILRKIHEKLSFILSLCQIYWELDKFGIFKHKTAGHSFPFGYIQCCGSGSVSQRKGSASTNQKVQDQN